jgi:hypothetical protein
MMMTAYDGDGGEVEGRGRYVEVDNFFKNLNFYFYVLQCQCYANVEFVFVVVVGSGLFFIFILLSILLLLLSKVNSYSSNSRFMKI